MTSSIDWLVVGGPVDPWLRLGLVAEATEDGGGRIPLFGTGIEVTGHGAPGMAGWVLSGIDASVRDIDGIVTMVRDVEAPRFAPHALAVQVIDHVVVTTDDLARTCGAIADVTGAPLKRVREAGAMRQGFHRLPGPGGRGGLVVEVVERTDRPPGPASLWGFALVVDDLDAACAALGADLVSEPRAAVQPGRTIATLREAGGVGVPIALMSPDPR